MVFSLSIIAYFTRFSIDLFAVEDKFAGVLIDKSTMAEEPIHRVLIFSISRTSSDSSNATVLTRSTSCSSLVSVNCFTASPIISTPVMQIIPPTSSPAAASAAAIPGIDIARPMLANAKIELYASLLWCQAFAITMVEFMSSPTFLVIRYNHSLLMMLIAAMMSAGYVGSVTAAAPAVELVWIICKSLPLEAAPTEIPVPRSVNAKNSEPTASNFPWP
mmetsp:Transcript_11437/g.17149  ORF Transcript_11437/g.17149 Transcript_11437/m.17149 type:complete len:218 (+) Transcript_11437:499-1152(+)